MDYQTLQQRLLEFRRQRDWEQFHDPKNLAEGLIIEAGELLENFLWKHPDQCRQLNETERKRVEEEIGDIFTFLIYLCRELDIDPFEAARRKIEINSQKYPVEKAKGKRTKYHDL